MCSIRDVYYKCKQSVDSVDWGSVSARNQDFLFYQCDAILDNWFLSLNYVSKHTYTIIQRVSFIIKLSL